MQDLTDKVVIVTGDTAGIGREVAIGLAKKGKIFNVVNY